MYHQTSVWSIYAGSTVSSPYSETIQREQYSLLLQQAQSVMVSYNVVCSFGQSNDLMLSIKYHCYLCLDKFACAVVILYGNW